MKSAVETLSPTRVKLTVEVPFEELKPSLDAAYKTIAGQVNMPGFRKGKVPQRLIDQRFGRGAVLEEAVNEALPRFYGQALEEHEVKAIGRPEVDVTEFNDGEQLAFTAEVDVRPEFDLPDYRGLAVTVDDAEVDEADVAEELDRLRARFGTLTDVERAVGDGDFVVLDIVGTHDGAPVDEATVSGLSYEIGSAQLDIEGLDAALQGLSRDGSTNLTFNPTNGQWADQPVDLAVTVTQVRERVLPALDDDFAALASEFDTLDELTAEIRTQLRRVKLMEQGVQARDKVLEQLVALAEVPVPEGYIAQQVKEHLEGEGKEEGDPHGEEVAGDLRTSLVQQFILDEVVKREELGATEPELTQHIVRTAQRYGMAPDDFASQVVQAGQVPMLVAEVVRGKALALVLESATVTDASGNPVDLKALDAQMAAAMEGLAPEGDDHEGHDHDDHEGHDHA